MQRSASDAATARTAMTKPQLATGPQKCTCVGGASAPTQRRVGYDGSRVFDGASGQALRARRTVRGPVGESMKALARDARAPRAAMIR